MLDITTLVEIDSLDLPLPIYKSKKIANALHDELGSFGIYVGLTREHVEQIQTYSLDLSDTALQESTTDYKRFGKGDYAERYTKKHRIQFVLVHEETGDVASMIWYGPEALPEGLEFTVAVTQKEKSRQWYTSAYRTYGKYRGVRITTAFSAYILDLYKKSHPKNPMSLAVQKANKPGIKLYTKLGFITIAQDNKENEYIMQLI